MERKLEGADVENTSTAMGAAPVENGLPFVAAVDFEEVDIEAPIAELQSVDCASFADPYAKAAKAAAAEQKDVAVRAYRLLAAVTQMHFKPGDRGEPYGPMFVMGGRRGIIPDDLRGEQSMIFAEIAPDLANAGLRALLADIAWLNNRKLATSAQLAIRSFTGAVELVAAGKAEFRFNEHGATSHTGADLLRRACQIASATGWKEPEASGLRALIGRLTESAFNTGDASGYLNVATLDLNYSVTASATVAFQAVNGGWIPGQRGGVKAGQ
ncbi:unannotated protein [freshwater metagenome]|uniref:Unannotated protein n=1 Tax=freshwater metagenome TaxID=449393 RepID=A0A6J5ZZU9_9ZZZZ|nr:hypothetical protein [Actinomycetota bacterium]